MDLIDRQAAIDAAALSAAEWDGMYVQDINGRIRKALEKLPSAQPERPKGRWIPQNHNKVNGMASTTVYYYPKCSVCGHCANYTNFCPACGADMRG